MEAAQAPLREAAGTSEQRQFDFWLGEWDLSWGDGATATNSVYRDFDGHVIVESFDGRPALELQGTSLSTYDPASGKWKQTWVDNQGSHYEFAGAFRAGEMELRTETEVCGRPTLLRMRWFNIREDALDWAWERSDDGGQHWTPLWEVAYSRVL